MNFWDWKVEFKTRIAEVGGPYWRLFLDKRGAYTRQGLLTKEAWLKAAEEVWAQVKEDDPNVVIMETPSLPKRKPGRPIGSTKKVMERRKEAKKLADAEKEAKKAINSPQLTKPYRESSANDILRGILWVYANTGVRDVDHRTAPDRGAIGLLGWVNASTLNKADFYKNILSKALPNKAQIESQSRFQDDGRAVIKLVERVRLEALEVQKEKEGPAV